MKQITENGQLYTGETGSEIDSYFMRSKKYYCSIVCFMKDNYDIEGTKCELETCNNFIPYPSNWFNNPLSSLSSPSSNKNNFCSSSCYIYRKMSDGTSSYEQTYLKKRGKRRRKRKRRRRRRIVNTHHVYKKRKLK
jgi:hypothetical protein